MANDRRSLEEPLARRVLDGMRGWLSRVRSAVLSSWNRFRGRPDPTAVYSTTPLWTQVVNSLVPDMIRAAKMGWSETTDRPYTGREQSIFDEMARVRSLLSNIPDETAKLIQDEIAKAVGMGASPDQIAEGVQRILTETGSNYWPNRARVIAVTTVHSMANAGSQAAMTMLQARSDKPLAKEWVSREDDRVRPTHHAADGQKVPVNSFFTVGGFPMLHPGDPNAPAEEVVNCVTGNTEIASSGIRKAFRFAYRGPLVSFVDPVGDVLSLSPNHPVLSESGWIPASQIKKGTKLVSGNFANGATRGTPDVQAEPALASEIYDSLALGGTADRIEHLAVNFHGDRPDGDVDVVFADRELRVGIEASDLEEFDKFCFAYANLLASSESPALHFNEGSLLADQRDVTRRDLRSPSIGSHLTPLEKFGLVSVTKGDPSIYQSAGDDGARDTNGFGERINRGAFEVALFEVGDVQVNEFHGYLYNFETISGIYMANNIVSHNCRCSMKLVEA